MSDWIEWKGGECPVPWDTQTAVRLRDGREDGDSTPQYWMWNHYGIGGDIIAYKVEKPAADSAPEPVRATHATSADISMLWEAIDGLKARIAELEGVV